MESELSGISELQELHCLPPEEAKTSVLILHFGLNIFSQEYQNSDRVPQKIFNESLLLNLTPLLHSTDMNPRRDRYGT